MVMIYWRCKYDLIFNYHINYCVHVEDSDTLMLLRSYVLASTSSHSTFPPKFTLASNPLETNTMCKMVSVHCPSFSSAVWPTFLGVVGHLAMANICYSNKLLIALLLQYHDTDITASAFPALQAFWCVNFCILMQMFSVYFCIRNFRIELLIIKFWSASTLVPRESNKLGEWLSTRFFSMG